MESNISNKVDAEDVELAERYVAALERIEHIEKEIGWNEDDVKQAEEYLATLIEIAESDIDTGK